MGGISGNKIGSIALLLGPVLAIAFFLVQPTGLLIDTVEPGNPKDAIAAYGANAGLTKLTSGIIALSLVVMIYGYSVVCSGIRNSGNSDALARCGLLFLQVGTIAWVLAQGVHFVLAGVSPESNEAITSSLSAYAVDAGITLLGSLVVSTGFFLFSLGVSARGGLYATTGLVIALVSLVSLASISIAIGSPDFTKTGIMISRICYFPWVLWSVGLGVSLLKEE